MAELAFTNKLRPAGYVLAEERVAWLEAVTDKIAAGAQPPAEFRPCREIRSPARPSTWPAR